MAAPSEQPRIRLSHLRDLGWRLWNPIGIAPPEAFPPSAPPDPARADNADEYDRYLVAAASALRREGDPAAVIAYLVDIEARHMGLGHRADTEARAAALVDAILADPSVWTWPDDGTPSPRT